MRRGIKVANFFVFLLIGFFSYPPPDGGDSRQPSAAIAYHLEEPPRDLKELQSRYGLEQLSLLEKLNRSDRSPLPRLKVLVVPDRWDLPELAYSPLPLHYPWAEKHKKVLIVDLAGQVFGGYEKGLLVRWGPVSSGSVDNPTPKGFYHLNWKSKGRHSTDNPEWYMRWYYNFANAEGRAFHAYALPGYPASHTCIRLLLRDAQWLFDWGEPWNLLPNGWIILKPGTPVVILGQYRFGEPPPWQSLEWLAQGFRLPVDPESEVPAFQGQSPLARP